MQINQDIINDIITKHLLGEINAEEQALLEEWRKNAENNQYFEEITEPANLRLQLRAYHKCVKIMEPEGQKIMEKHEALIASPVLYVPGRKLLKAAVCIIILLFAGGYFWFTRTPKPEEPVPGKSNVTVKQDDVLPGKHKAILLLADGTKIGLDSFSRGQLPPQGNTIINNIDGRLEYHTGTETEGAPLIYNTLTTEKGQTYAVTLPDGSKVWLNAASGIKYPVAFTGTERRVNITGEAYFEIKPLAQKQGEHVPFIITVEDSAGNSGEEVEVLGTQFNINAYKEEKIITTTLLKGKVKLTKGKNVILSEPNQQGLLSKATGDLVIENNTNVERIVAWKNNYFYFERDSLATVIKQIARWYDVDFVYDKRLSNKTFSGRIQRNMPLLKVLEKLKMTSGVQFIIHQGKRIAISPKPQAFVRPYNRLQQYSLSIWLL